MSTSPTMTVHPTQKTTGGVRVALLEAARALFAERTFKEVTVREIARAAGANPAMINYYFGGKQGLYEQLVGEALAPLIDVARLDTVEGAQGAPQNLLGNLVSVLAANPWLPNLWVREVLYGQGPFRDLYIERFGRRLASRVKQTVKQGGAVTEGEIQKRTLALMSLLVFPFLARPIVEEALGIEVDEAFTGDWTLFVMDLLDLVVPKAEPGP